ncbi:hypothetical protein ACH5RR_010403 [Cinchona calisaya]|uniref:Cytochrome P450 n=1 Tax=Cinchona calisaya TaxID=153742 RepID=A0ABD3AIV0_9GENT
MDLLPHLLAIAGVLVLLLLYKQRRVAIRNPDDKGLKSPPEPAGAWPFVGHLPQLSSHNTLARTLGALADKYGPVFAIRVGMIRILVINNSETVKECFTTNDIVFASRPNSNAGIYLGYNYAAFGFAPYGPFWRQMRKLVLLEVLSNRRLENLRHVRVSEIEMSIKELFSVINDNRGTKVVISDWLEQLTLNMIVRTIAGNRYSDTEVGTKIDSGYFKKVVKEFMYVTGKLDLSDVIPIQLLRWLDIQGHIKSMKRLFKELDAIMQIWIDEHIGRRNMKSKPAGDERDFIDVMLSVIEDEFTFGHSKETLIKATIMNLILAGSDTTSVHLTWILALLLNNRHVMKQAQEEIRQNVGEERWVEESDIKNLLYLQAIVKETLRLYPPGPLSVPHEAREDCQVSGYHIRKGTRLFVNVWKLHRDPTIWSEPDKFLPERFMTSHAEVDVSGQHFEFTPFGSGRRSCPGITFAMHVTHLTLARLLQGFDFSTPSNLPVDMTEGQGMTLPKVNPLEVLIVPRLPVALY